eukprot:m51a1_g1082 hypothetical protein (110) ;mRNA; r:24699-25136
MDVFGDKYEGPRAKGGNRMEGHGVYTFANGDRFVGTLKDGMFHGRGILYFCGSGHGRFEGEWKNGVALRGDYYFGDNLRYKAGQEWSYCAEPDRRLYSEHVNGIPPFSQ